MIKQLDLFAAFAAAEVQPVVAPVASPVEVKKEPVRISAAMREAFRQEVSEFGFGSRIYHICREQAKQELKDIEAGKAFASPRYKKMLKSY
jgi:hypothetical protein